MDRYKNIISVSGQTVAVQLETWPRYWSQYDRFYFWSWTFVSFFRSCLLSVSASCVALARTFASPKIAFQLELRHRRLKMKPLNGLQLLRMIVLWTCQEVVGDGADLEKNRAGLALRTTESIIEGLWRMLKKQTKTWVQYLRPNSSLLVEVKATCTWRSTLSVCLFLWTLWSKTCSG